MWTRAELKERAKDVLRGAYWKCFLISLVIAIAGGSNGGSPNFNWTRNSEYMDSEFVRIIMMVAGSLAFAGVLFRIFLGYILEVGGRKYFTRASEQDVNMNYLGYGFKGKYYGQIILTMLYRAFLLFLWFLLLIIPGVIKSYAYRMVPFILADNPEIGVKRAVALSNEMTKGEKFNMFVLDLSFIGWYLLGVLALFVGVLFVQPYVDATYAELYLTLRENGLKNGLCTYDELHVAAETVETDSNYYF